MEQEDNNTYWEISNDESEDLGESTLSSDIEEDDWDNRQEVIILDHVRRDKRIRITRVPLPKNGSFAITVIACTPLPVGAITPPLLKCQMSAIHISRESDVVQALPHPMAGGDQSVLEPNAGGDHNFPPHQKALWTWQHSPWRRSSSQDSLANHYQ